MRMIDKDGIPEHDVIQRLMSMSSNIKKFMELLQKSSGINNTDPNFIEVYASFKGVFTLSSGTISDAVIITSNAVGSAYNKKVTGDSTKTLTTLVGGGYTIIGDGTQVPKTGEVIAISGGISKADDTAARNIVQGRWAELIETDAVAIDSFYDGL